MEELYGTAIATTKVSGINDQNTIGKFVTFKVNYAGTYMIVASHTNEGYKFTNSLDGNGQLKVTSNTYGVQPSLGGLFFDKTSPLADISHSITYVLDDGVCEENPDVYVEGVGVAAFEPAVKPGYTFQGWYTQAGGQGEKIESIPATAKEDYTLYAYFTENQPCNITYHIENGKNGRGVFLCDVVKPGRIGLYHFGHAVSVEILQVERAFRFAGGAQGAPRGGASPGRHPFHAGHVGRACRGLFCVCAGRAWLVHDEGDVGGDGCGGFPGLYHWCH